ncbi:nose resistant to fluoxetine protein 6-like [Metopolophium dirhodum]|uniref:nose resistant to fluoxetine protein 6-like n=1 Tax=Metopolophium dirhodum TaxID=44670 RepID=UPI00299035F4|nr:nose resistant to fluoxetine protein 6-like [Metopolophium dirhodum]
MSFYPPAAVAIVLIALLSTEYSNGQVASNNESTMALNAGANTPDAGIPGSWVSDLFYQALANFTVRHVGSSECRKQVEIYDNSLRNYTSWAVRMSESWNRYPVGLLAGNRYQMGVYDECVDVHHPIRGQYCLSEIKLFPPEGKNYGFNRTENLDDFGNNHAWKTVLGWVDYPDQVQRNSLNLGICIPNSCTATDLQTSLQNELDKVFLPEQFKTVVKVNPLLCTVSGDMYPYNTAYYVTNVVLGVLFLICGVSTAHHYIALSRQQVKKEDERKVPKSFFYKFSFIRSFKVLLKFDKENEFNMLNGWKAILMFVILLGHRFMYLVGNPIINPKFIENIYVNGRYLYLTSMNLTDPFFFITGFLIYSTLVPIYKKSEKSVLAQLVMPIVYRIIRILPAYGAMMAITAHIVPHLGDGPLWPYKTWDEADICKNYWWTNMLFISNLIDSKYECLIVSWYISCDVQFCVLGVIIVYVYTKNIKFGIGLLIAVIGVAISVPFVITILTKREGIIKILLPFLENTRYSATFNESYRASYVRAFPFFIGIAIGIIIDKLRENKVKFSQITVYAGTFTIAVICLWVQFYGAIFYKRDRPYYPLEQALYSTLSHCTWSILFSWILVCHFTSGYGLLLKFFSNRFIVPMGRLSYSVFLVNLTVMMISQSRMRSPNYLSKPTVVDAWFYDALKSYFMGLLLFLVVEAPLGSLATKFIKRK